MGMDGTRAPEWLLPDDVMVNNGLCPATRNKIRPDVLIMEMTAQERFGLRVKGGSLDYKLPSHIRKRREPRRPRKVWIIEGGYCSDLNMDKKHIEKTGQHASLERALTGLGMDVKVVAIPLGAGGSILAKTLEDLIELQIPITKAKKTLRKMSLHAITCLHSIVISRRQIERQQWQPP